MAKRDEKKATQAQASAAPEAAAPAAPADQGGVAGGAGDAGSSEPASGSAAPAVPQPQGDDQGQGDAPASTDAQNAPADHAVSGEGANTGEVGGGPSGAASSGAGDGGGDGSGSFGLGETQAAELEPATDSGLDTPVAFQRGDRILVEGNCVLSVLSSDEQYVIGVNAAGGSVIVPLGKVLEVIG